MPEGSRDHTRSLVQYQDILEACENEYRTTPLTERQAVIDNIAEQIQEAASKGRVKVAEDERLHKVCV